MLYKNLTVKELFATIPLTKDVVELFNMGIRRNNDRLAGAAMEELIRRDETCLIVEALDKFFETPLDSLASQTMMFALLRDLAECCRKEDALLGSYARQQEQACSSGHTCDGPTEWIKKNAERYKRFYRSGAVRNAKPWAKEYLRREEVEA